MKLFERGIKGVSKKIIQTQTAIKTCIKHRERAILADYFSDGYPAGR